MNKRQIPTNLMRRYWRDHYRLIRAGRAVRFPYLLAGVVKMVRS